MPLFLRNTNGKKKGNYMKTDNERKRHLSNEYYPAKDFLILYRFFKSEYTKQNNEVSTYSEVRINFPKFLTKEQRKRNKKPYGKSLLKSGITIPVKDISDTDAVKNAIDNKIWADEGFRKVVKSEVIDAFENGRINDISLLLFSYAFYDEISKNIGFSDNVFLTIVKNIEFCNLMLGTVTYFNLKFLVAPFTYYNKNVTEKAVLVHLNYILNCAYEKGFKKEKIDFDLKNNDRLFAEDRKAYSNRMKALGEKSLTIKSETELIKWLMKEYKKGNYKYLGVLIKLFTGMSSPEVCALQWNDYEEIKYSHGKRHHFVVSKKMKDSSKNYEYFDSSQKHKYRLVPIPAFLDDLVSEQYKRLIKDMVKKYRKEIRYELTTKKEHNLVKTLLSTLGKENISYKDFKKISDDDFYKYYKKDIEEEIKDYPIIAIHNKKTKERDMYKKPYTTSAFRHISKKALNEGVAKVENKSKMYNSQKIIDYSKHGNTLFHTNYQFHAIENCGLKLGELNYIIGNSDTDTFSKHYYDFSNDLGQIQLAKKLDRWADVHFIQEKPEIAYTKKTIEETSCQLKTIKAGKNELAAATVIITANGSLDAEIIIENNHGFDGDVALYIND